MPAEQLTRSIYAVSNPIASDQVGRMCSGPLGHSQLFDGSMVCSSSTVCGPQMDLLAELDQFHAADHGNGSDYPTGCVLLCL